MLDYFNLTLIRALVRIEIGKDNIIDGIRKGIVTETILFSVLALIGIVGTVFSLWLSLKLRSDRKLTGNAKQYSANLLNQAEEEKRKLVLEAQENALNIRTESENEIKAQRQELNRLENRNILREESLENKSAELQGKEEELLSEREQLESSQKEIEVVREEVQSTLENIASLSAEEARTQVVSKAEDDLKYDLARRNVRIEREFKAQADEVARNVLTLAINRLSTDVVSEGTTSVVHLPSDDMKGRLIGREGRNIRTLESLTGVDVMIDDTPGLVTVSCFDPVRREVAKLALEKLISDGRIQPSRIEETVQRATDDIDQIIWKAGEQAIFDTGISGLDPELIRHLGRLKYRFSYGENVLKHSIEVGLMSGIMAAEIGANVDEAKLGGLLHDIGKALTHEVQGPHAEIGAELAERNGVSSKICMSIAEHHDDHHNTDESFLVSAADTLSAARPGARKESVELYVQRLQDLETAATSFDGVDKAFAIQAGREVRVLVKPDDIDDLMSSDLARNIAQKVEKELVYPGQIKVTVIRETRSTEYAQ